MRDADRVGRLAGEAKDARSILGALLAAVETEPEALADRLIDRFGSLSALLAAPPGRLAALAGEPAATLLAAHRRTMLFVLREAAVRGVMLATRYELLDYCRQAMAHDPYESLRVFFVNPRRELIAEEVIAQGDAAGIAVEPRRVLARALELGATGLILVHNHPSGDPAPSTADRRFTRSLAHGAGVLGLELHDHLVVARDGCTSIGVSR